MNRKIRNALILFLLFFLSYITYNIIYRFYFLPVIKVESNVEVVNINGTEYALHRLTYNGQTYMSDPLDDGDEYELGKQVGRTEDYMQIYEVKNDDKILILQGFMYPAEVYKKVNSKNHRLKTNELKKE